MKIKLKNSTMVRPAKATPTTSLWLSNLDLVMPVHNHVPSIYLYPSNGTHNFFDSMVMMEALSRALVPFYPAAGRLKMVNDRIEINCNGKGVLFLEAEADGVMEDLGDFLPKPHLALTPKVDYSHGISTFPLLLVQVTQFKCGGVCLGTAFDHHVADGISGPHLFYAWSEISRGLDISVPPFHDRKAILSAHDPPRPKFIHDENFRMPPTMKPPLHRDDTIVFKKFMLTRDQINALKEQCKEDDKKGSYTTYEVVAGHAWRCATIARQLPKDQQTKFTMTVDGRSKLQPPLPSGYFGNVVFAANPSLLAGEQQYNPLIFSVRKVHEAISRMNDDYLRSIIDSLECEADLTSLSKRLHGCSCPNLLLVYWEMSHRVEADFGWGKPIHVGPGGLPPDGFSTILSISDECVIYLVSLYKQHMHLFEKLFYGF